MTSAVSAWLVYTNAKIRFSFQIISLIAVSCVGTLIFQAIWRNGHQNVFHVVLFGLAIFTMQLFVPISIFFTKRQWKLLKLHQIRNCNSIERLRTLTQELGFVKYGFKVLLYASLLCTSAYAVSIAIFSHYAIHVEPCNQDYQQCPRLINAVVFIRILQFCMYLAYSICAGLMCLFAYRMH